MAAFILEDDVTTSENVSFLYDPSKPYPDLDNLTLHFTVAGDGAITLNSIFYDDD